MTALLVLLLLVVASAVLGTVRAVLTDGYGPRPDRHDRYAAARPL